MGDNRTDLPEGTDTVITGASNPITGPAAGGGTSGAGAGSESGGGEDVVLVTETTLVTATEVPASGGDAGTAGSPSGAASQAGIAGRLRAGSEKLTGQAADKARGLVSQGLERSAEALANVGKLVGDTAPGLEERLGPEFGDYARRAAETIESTANSIAAKDADELIDDTRNFVRKSPAVALAGAAIIGFAVARLIKTGLDSGRDDDDDNSRS